MGALLDNLRQDVGQHGTTAWAPGEPGEGIEGDVIAITTRDADPNKRRSAYPVIALDLGEDPDDRGGLDRWVAWHAAGQIAAEQLDAHRPTIGDRLAVLFLGEHRSAGGNRYKRWAIAVEHRRPAPEELDPNDPRTRIKATVLSIEDAATRNRVKTAFAHRFGVLRTLPDDRIDEATTWIHQGLTNGWPENHN
jgi:hypothetical protein